MTPDTEDRLAGEGLSVKRLDMSKVAALPWEYVPSTEHHGPYVTNAFGNTIADLYVMTLPHELSTRNDGPSRPVPHLGEMADPNAALIVAAVNAYDPDREQRVRELIAAVRALMGDLYIDEHPEDFHPDWHRLNAALASFAEDK